MMAKNRHDDLKGLADREKVVASMHYRFQCDKRIVMLVGTRGNEKDRRELEGMMLWRRFRYC